MIVETLGGGTVDVADGGAALEFAARLAGDAFGDVEFFAGAAAVGLAWRLKADEFVGNGIAPKGAAQRRRVGGGTGIAEAQGVLAAERFAFALAFAFTFAFPLTFALAAGVYASVRTTDGTGTVFTACQGQQEERGDDDAHGGSMPQPRRRTMLGRAPPSTRCDALRTTMRVTTCSTPADLDIDGDQPISSTTCLCSSVASG